MRMCLEVRPYRRSFRKPLATAHGRWEERLGFLIRIAGKDGKFGYGEVAPIPWLGSETWEEAGRFLDSLAGRGGLEGMGAISRLPACRFAIDAAMAELREENDGLPIRPLEVAALLPAGRAGLEVMEKQVGAGYRTFKWKIGMETGEVEREIFRELQAAAPPENRFRVDANEGLTLAEARKWLELMDETGVEFFEQPLPAAAFEEMLQLSKTFATPIALDESVGNGREFEASHRRKWTGLYVVKPSLFGAMREAAGLLPPLRPRLIFSSAFETSIGFEGVLRWASRWHADGTAAGLGIHNSIVEDGLFIHPSGPRLIRGLVDPARVWERAEKMSETCNLSGPDVRSWRGL